MQKNNLVLIGFMSVGKTTVGQRIAQMLNKSFIDTDKKIEDTLGISINEVFHKKGEKYFREIERQVIQRIAGYENCVISTGGGVVLNKSNLDLLKKNGIIVCLTAPAEVIYERVKNNNDRPLLARKDPYSRIQQMLKDREALYQCADFYVDTSVLTVNEAADKIILYANNYNQA